MPRDLIRSDATIRAVKPGDPRKRLNDGQGLYLKLFVRGGSHAWRFGYTFHGLRREVSLGTYPDTGLALAREKADEARRLLAAGIDPSQHRREERAQQVEAARGRNTTGAPPPGSFEAVAREWFELKSHEWVENYAKKVIRRLEMFVFPALGRRPVQSITVPELLTTLRKIESAGTFETTHRTLEICGQVFRYAIATGRAEVNPGRDLRDALRKAPTRHYSAVLEPNRLGEVLRAFDSYKGGPIVRVALFLLPRVLLRPGELRHARWPEIDLDKGVWIVPSARLKRLKANKASGDPHVVPLSKQVVRALRELHALTGRSEYVFPGLRSRNRPISDAAMSVALRTMGFTADEIHAHGFRATARTMLVERLGYPSDWIETQLAHAPRDPLGRAYDRTSYQSQRTEMMQAWSDYLDGLRFSDVFSAEAIKRLWGLEPGRKEVQIRDKAGQPLVPGWFKSLDDLAAAARMLLTKVDPADVVLHYEETLADDDGEAAVEVQNKGILHATQGHVAGRESDTDSSPPGRETALRRPSMPAPAAAGVLA